MFVEDAGSGHLQSVVDGVKQLPVAHVEQHKHFLEPLDSRGVDSVLAAERCGEFDEIGPMTS